MEFYRPEYSRPEDFLSPGDLPNLGIKPRSPALWADSLPAEPPGKPQNKYESFAALAPGSPVTLTSWPLSCRGLCDCQEMHPALRDREGPPAAGPASSVPAPAWSGAGDSLPFTRPPVRPWRASLQGVEPVPQTPTPSGLAANPPQEVQVGELTEERGRVSDPRRSDTTADSPFTPITL